MARPNIMIVEDEIFIAHDLKSTLEDMGYKITSIVKTSEEAIKKAKEDRPDVILMDIQLEGEKDGIETAEYIKSKLYIPIIFLTAYVDEEKLKRVKNTLPFGYVLKPFEDSQLKVVIELALYSAKVDAERRKAEKALKESEKSYRTLAENLPGLVYRVLIREDNRLSFFNKMLTTMTGYTAQELGKGEVCPIESKMVPEDRAPIQAVLKTAILEDKPFEIEYRFRHKDGSTRNFFERGRPIYGQDGRPLYIDGVIFDITERKNIEAALKESEEKYRTVVEKANDGIAIVQDTIIKYANPKLAYIIGCTVEELQNTSFIKYIAPDEIHTVMENYQQHMEAEKSPPKYETRMLHKDGRKIDIEINATYINYLGRLAELVIVRDITDRKRVERKLAEEKERLDVTLQSIGEGVITTDMNGKILIMNRVAEKLTGWTMEKAVGRPIQEVFYTINEKTRQRCENSVDKVLKTGGLVGPSIHTLLIARDGTQRFLADSGAPISNRSGTIVGVVLVFRDITKELKMEEELSKLHKLESIGILAGGIAHDFNNLLTPILGNISLAKMYSNPGDQTFTLLSETEKATKQAKILTQQLLTFSKGGAPIKKPSNVAAVLKNSVSFTLRGSNVRCNWSLPDDIWTLKIDADQITQVFQNIVINADQAMPDGGTVNICAENIIIPPGCILPLQEGKYVKVSIQDHGVGIPEEYLPKIFDPYFTTKQKGNGLGLAVCYSIIKKHDGHIVARSKVGSGTTFEIYLPATEDKFVEKKEADDAIVPGEGRILILDDEEMILKTVSYMLKQMGYDVEAAEDGQECIELYKKAKESGAPFDFVIVDLTIPGGMGGKDVLERLLEIDPGVKVIVSSGYSHDPIMSKHKEYGFSGVITKPYAMKELSEALHSVKETSSS